MQTFGRVGGGAEPSAAAVTGQIFSAAHIERRSARF
jgi:hypothetical protein